VELARLLRADPPGHAIRKSKVAPGPYITPMVSQPRLDPAASPRLHDYQRVAHTPGPLLAACLLVVIVALVLARGRGRLLSRRGGRAGRRASSAPASRASAARSRPAGVMPRHRTGPARSDTPAASRWRNQRDHACAGR